MVSNWSSKLLDGLEAAPQTPLVFSVYRQPKRAALVSTKNRSGFAGIFGNNNCRLVQMLLPMPTTRQTCTSEKRHGRHHAGHRCSDPRWSLDETSGEQAPQPKVVKSQCRTCVGFREPGTGIKTLPKFGITQKRGKLVPIRTQEFNKIPWRAATRISRRIPVRKWEQNVTGPFQRINKASKNNRITLDQQAVHHPGNLINVFEQKGM